MTGGGAGGSAEHLGAQPRRAAPESWRRLQDLARDHRSQPSPMMMRSARVSVLLVFVIGCGGGSSQQNGDGGGQDRQDTRQDGPRDSVGVDTTGGHDTATRPR